ncbi:fused signal recognition particle receptor [Marinobacter sp. es.042]|uniref:signal recognition particle-docking protein FtsY n=1 Tax=Marinobacter sp. es.042 TaxID=1761794 RepID=UPI000B50E373|nr:signal recognition particle-docking protein FtsY [Marinobacter sp. es.042]MCR9188041.1 signal recognition particle-docking protein FtsY [Alteromonadaceae bacterium]SNB58813.1 fused signal recognition particle receptor [Marinobacter sp. es.042]
MTAEWISIGLLALLVLVFVLDIAGNRSRAPRPKPVPQRKPEVSKGPAPEPEEGEIEAPAAAEPQPEPVAEPEPTPEPAEEPQKAPEPEPQVSVFERIKKGLGKTRASLTGGLSDMFSLGKKIDEELLEEIETTLLMADVGVTATSEIIDSLTDKLERNQLKDGEALRKALRDELHGLLKDVTKPLQIDSGKTPYVILMVGVNGVGKTTTIGKLTKKFQNEGKSVMLAAGDTFRAAAVEQLQVWGERNKVPVVAQHTGADSASVIFDAIQSAKSRGVDVVIADTAGRLQNKDNLMQELEKVVRVMKKLDESAPHEVMLVLDAGTGQNALSQAQVFQQAVGVSGITLTKLDGTAKGGIVFAIARQLQLPIRFIGVGEQVDDLRSFDAETFVDALFDE